MKVLLVDQIAKVNYKYTFPLANGLEKAGAKVLLAIDQKQEKENCRCERINLFNTDEKNVGKLEKMQNYIASYKKIGELLRTEKFDVLHALDARCVETSVRQLQSNLRRITMDVGSPR